MKMKSCFLVLLFFGLTYCSEVTPGNKHDVKRGIFPYMAFIYYSDPLVLDASGQRFIRSAVLVRPEWLVTTALGPSIIDSDSGFPSKTLLARAGSIAIDDKFTLNEDEDEQEREIVQIVRPSNYSATQWWTTDISLMMTLVAFNMTSAVGVKALDFRHNLDTKTCSILVYAKKTGSATEGKTLLMLFVELLPPSIENCGAHFTTDTMTCAVDGDGNKHVQYAEDFCQGNSGGPLICEHEIVGLQTYIGNNCKQPYLYQLLHAWEDFVTCGIEDKCQQEQCSKICEVNYKDPPKTTAIITTPVTEDTTAIITTPVTEDTTAIITTPVTEDTTAIITTSVTEDKSTYIAELLDISSNSVDTATFSSYNKSSSEDSFSIITTVMSTELQNTTNWVMAAPLLEPSIENVSKKINLLSPDLDNKKDKSTIEQNIERSFSSEEKVLAGTVSEETVSVETISVETISEKTEATTLKEEETSIIGEWTAQSAKIRAISRTTEEDTPIIQDTTSPWIQKIETLWPKVKKTTSPRLEEKRITSVKRLDDQETRLPWLGELKWPKDILTPKPNVEETTYRQNVQPKRRSEGVTSTGNMYTIFFGFVVFLCL